MANLPEDLNEKVNNMTNLQKAYCRFRAKGLTAAESSSRAGSTAKDKGSLSRVGYQIEQMDGTKDYIEYLKSQRSQISSIDDHDLVTFLKDVYDQSMVDKNYREANKAAELIAKCLGMFSKDAPVALKIAKQEKEKNRASESVRAFQEDDDEENLGNLKYLNDKLERIQLMVNQVDKDKV